MLLTPNLLERVFYAPYLRCVESELGDIFESFSSHPPLILPLGSSRLRLTGPVTDDALHRELRRLRRLLWDLEQQELPANHRHGPPVASTP